MSTHFAHRIPRLSNWAMISLFFLAILSPSLRMLTSPIVWWSSRENRVLATMPPAPKSIGDFIAWRAEIDNFLKDHFGFREFYIKLYHETLRLFNVMPVSVPVLQGLDGWYFFTLFHMIDDFYGRIPLSDTQLQAWIEAQKARKRWLGERGIHYLLLIAPNKQSIYPQMLVPNALAMRGQSRYDQLLAKLGGETPDFMPDLQRIFKAYADKPSSPLLYYKTDTHWNDLGAYLAFGEIMKKLSAWFPDTNFKTDFLIIPQVKRGSGDLAKMMMRSDLGEISPMLAPARRHFKILPLSYPISDIPREPDRPSFLTRLPDPGNRPRALIFRDSFFVPMVPLLAENFSEILFIWKGYDQKNVEEALKYFKPDVVIEEIVERAMFDFLLSPKEQP